MGLFRKKLVLAVGAVLAMAFNANATIQINETNFPDEVFRNWVKNNLAGGASTVDENTVTEILFSSSKDTGVAGVTSVKGIELFPNLQKLSLTGVNSDGKSHNQITSIDISKNKKLIYLECKYNQALTAIDLSQNVKLQHVDLNNVRLNSIDVSMLPDLDYLDIVSSNCTSLDVTHNPKLKYLAFSYNDILRVDLSNCLDIETLYCYNTGLAYLDLSKHTKIKYLNCGGNQISRLDISKCPLTEWFSCTRNRLLQLDETTMGSDFIQKHGTNLVSEQTRNLPAILVERNGKKMYAVKMPWGVEGRGEVFIDGFKEVSLPEQGAKTYRISCKKDTEYGIDISGDSKEDEVNVIIYKTNQTFEITKLDNGYYSIMRNGKAIDVWGSDNMADGNNVATYSYWGGDNQQWKFVRNDDGSYTIVSKKDENFALTVDGGTMANSTNLQVNKVDGSDSQKWILEPVDKPEKDLYISDVLTEGVEKVTEVVNGKPVTTFYFEDWKSSFKYNYYIKNPYADKKMDVTITPTNDYHSRFIPASKLNTYYNKLVFNVRPDNGETRTIVRKNMATGETTVIATVQYSGVNGRNYSVTYINPLVADRYNALRFNTWSATTSGTTSDGTTVDDYFTASTADGGDKAGVYLYYVQEEPDADPVEVPVYAGKATAEIYVGDNVAIGYTLDEINSDTDHHLSTDYSAHVSHDQITDRFYDATKVYMNNREVANIDSKSPYIDVTETLVDNNKYACELVAIWPNQTNTYGTDEVELSFADLDIQVHDLKKSEVTFHDHSRYYTCLIDAVLKGDNISNVGGGLRAWRTINDPDEDFAGLLGRGNDFLFQSNMDLDGNQFNFLNIGGEPMSYEGHNFTNGVVGSKSHMPYVNYILRGYFKLATPSKVAGKDAAPAQDRYYIVERELSVNFTSNGIVTSVDELNGTAQVAEVTYYNLAGVASAQPHDGMNIVVTRYTDGTTTSSKLIK